MKLCRSSGGAYATILLLASLGLLLFALPMTNAEGQQQQLTDRQINENLERKLNETMASQSVKYTTVNVTGLPYNASTTFNPKGMGQLYNVTNMFIDFIQPKQAYPEGMIKLVNGQPVLVDPATEWRMIVKHYGGLAGLGLAGLLLAAVLPCVGLFFCCCRCAGRCGARSEPFDKKHDHCRKVILSVLLIGFATILLFGVVCAFVTNEYMQDGTRELPQAAKTSLGDVKLYLHTSKRQIDTLLKVNYEELEVALNKILQASGRIVTEQLAEHSHAVSLMNLNDIVVGLESIQKDLRMMNEITRELRNNASHLDNLVRKVRTNLQSTLTKCGSQECRDVMNRYKITEMNIAVEFDKLPDNDVTNALNKIAILMEDNIVTDVSDGMEQFMNIQKEIQEAVNETIPAIKENIRRVGAALTNTASSIVQPIDRMNQNIDKSYIPHLDLARRHIDQYSPYRYYLGLGISSILLTVLTCLTFGLLCGICGKRPDGYGDDCCNKGSGARFLMMAVWIIFLLTSILMIITVAHMITGVMVQRAVCEPLKNPNDNRLFELVDEWFPIKKILYPKTPNADINMSYILNSCHRNETLYTVLKLHYIIDIDTMKNYIYRYDINQTIQELEDKISLSGNYKIISDPAKEKLNELASSGLSDIKFFRYTENLKDKITTINLELLASKLRELASKLSISQEEIKQDLLKNAYDLELYHRNIVVPMSQLSTKLNDSAIELQEHIKFNHTSMAEAIRVLVEEVDQAQKFITEQGSAYVKILTAEFGKAFIEQVSNYLDHVMKNILTTVGKCGPISNAYSAAIVSGCNKILDPFNGFWASVGWCLIIFIPTIILCVKLSALYQKSDPYPGPLVEAEYLYDAYADRDNVPLAHIHDKKYVAHTRHHPGGGYPESYDGPAIGYSDRERICTDAHQSTSHHDSRYSDLAPNLSPAPGSHQAQKASPAKQNNTTKVFSISLNKSQ